MRTEANLMQLGYRAAAAAVQARALSLSLHMKAGFRPGQLRVPAGNSDGGQWADGGSTSRATPISHRGPRQGSHRRIMGRSQAVTPAQAIRLDASTAEMREAIRAVAKIDPTWRPPPQLFETVEGNIQANQATTRDAWFRVYELRSPRIGPGPFQAEWLPATGTGRLSREQQRKINEIGRRRGCHRCGCKTPGTLRGGFIGDHQMPSSLGTPLRLYPHCITCSCSQGGIVRHGGS
jgi:hypothetical protein